ncbi:MAG: ATP-binding cassette domain-containing protein [Vicingaceae bacterium]
MNSEEVSSTDKIISLQGAGISQKNHLVLDNVNLVINRGEFVFLVGKNGSGKSSFLKTLYGELKLQNGEALVSDFTLHKIKRKKIPFLRRKIGIVFQDFQLLTDRSVHENLKFVLRATGWKDKNKIEERIDEVLDHVGLVNKKIKYPHELSGGEQQRVAIARSLLNEPEIILADEPTGNLDPETSDEIMKIFHRLSEEGIAVIMASHDYVLMKKYGKRTLKFDEGRIEEVPV